jgi:sec-independent protein translocase protein TatB
MFNLSGSEVVLILLLALVVLGPEKLPEAIRRFGRLYGELKRMSSGFQTEFRSAFDEPLRELRETAQLTKEAVQQASVSVDRGFTDQEDDSSHMTNSDASVDPSLVPTDPAQAETPSPDGPSESDPRVG